GNDGGTIAKRDELVRTKAAEEKADPESARLARWTQCFLSRSPLRPPVVSDPLGRLYNKDVVIENLLARHAGSAMDGSTAAGMSHIRGLKDLVELNLTPNPDYASPSAKSESSEAKVVPYICPLTSRQMNGIHRFVYIATCGCVVSQQGLRAVVTIESTSSSSSSNKDSSALDPDKVPCPSCGKPFSTIDIVKRKSAAKANGEKHGNVITLNPSAEEEAEMRNTMESRRAQEAARKANKSTSRSKSRCKADPSTTNGNEKLRAGAKAARRANVAACDPEVAPEGDKQPIPTSRRPEQEHGGANSRSPKRTRMVA
ncbi:DUF602-domain-containing protein, partial [Testicularia cyperi]